MSIFKGMVEMLKMPTKKKELKYTLIENTLV